MRDSAIYLAEHLHEAPVFVIPCIEGRPTNPAPSAQAGFYGSILPAAWSLMLALRARGLGSAWTTLHLPYEKEVAARLFFHPFKKADQEYLQGLGVGVAGTSVTCSAGVTPDRASSTARTPVASAAAER